MTLHFSNDVPNEAESTQKYTRTAAFDINLPGSASRRHVEWLGEPRDMASVLKALPGNLDIKKLRVIIAHGKIAQ